MEPKRTTIKVCGQEFEAVLAEGCAVWPPEIAERVRRRKEKLASEACRHLKTWSRKGGKEYARMRSAAE